MTTHQFWLFWEIPVDSDQESCALEKPFISSIEIRTSRVLDHGRVNGTYLPEDDVITGIHKRDPEVFNGKLYNENAGGNDAYSIPTPEDRLHSEMESVPLNGKQEDLPQQILGKNFD